MPTTLPPCLQAARFYAELGANATAAERLWEISQELVERHAPNAGADLLASAHVA